MNVCNWRAVVGINKLVYGLHHVVSSGPLTVHGLQHIRL
jgi:hypothetical protein